MKENKNFPSFSFIFSSLFLFLFFHTYREKNKKEGEKKMEKQREKRIKKKLMEMGITPELRGYHFFVYEIGVVRQYLDRGEHIERLMELHAMAGQSHGLAARSVDRDLRQALMIGRNRSPKFAEVFAGYEETVTTSCFIYTMAELLMLEE